MKDGTLSGGDDYEKENFMAENLFGIGILELLPIYR